MASSLRTLTRSLPPLRVAFLSSEKLALISLLSSLVRRASSAALSRRAIAAWPLPLPFLPHCARSMTTPLRGLEPTIQAEAGFPATSRRWNRDIDGQRVANLGCAGDGRRAGSRAVGRALDPDWVGGLAGKRLGVARVVNEG